MILYKKCLLLFLMISIISISLHARYLLIDNQTGEDLNISLVYQNQFAKNNTWQFEVFLLASASNQNIDYKNDPPKKIHIATSGYSIGEITDPRVFSINGTLSLKKTSPNEYIAEWKKK